jgi:hypothetical protein
MITGLAFVNKPPGLNIQLESYDILNQLIGGKMKFQRYNDGYNGIPSNRTTVYSLF